MWAGLMWRVWIGAEVRDWRRVIQKKWSVVGQGGGAPVVGFYLQEMVTGLKFAKSCGVSFFFFSLFLVQFMFSVKKMTKTK